jgi:ABC-type transporter Mla subunit MlaD
MDSEIESKALERVLRELDLVLDDLDRTVAELERAKGDTAHAVNDVRARRAEAASRLAALRGNPFTGPH